jgi:hypothetical protein
MRSLGLVINPVNHQIAEASVSDGFIVRCYSISLNTDIASGTLERRSGNEYSLSAELSGYPRIHAIPGVRRKFRKEKGWGVCLYTAAAIAAKMGASNAIKLDIAVGNKPGVSSIIGTRSKEADAWWQKAHARGMTQVRRFCVGTPKTCGDVDLYTYASADKLGLIVSTGEAPPSNSHFSLATDSALAKANSNIRLAPLLAADVGCLKHAQSKKMGNASMERILKLLELGGGSSTDAEMLIERFEAGADASTARKNPSSPKLRESIEQSADIRKRLGWDRLAGME